MTTLIVLLLVLISIVCAFLAIVNAVARYNLTAISALLLGIAVLIMVASTMNWAGLD